jgi:N-acetylated-alpha-linked acidic dipeptidase
VTDPETGASVQERLRARMQVQGLDKGGVEGDAAVARERNARLAAAGGDLPIGALGSGSDYSAYLQHLGLASLDIEYGGEEDQDGVYHSNFDSFDHYVRFGDPGFAYGVADAKTIGHIVLRMADAAVLPLQFTGVADTLGDYLTQLRTLTEEKRTNTAQVTRLIDTHAFALAADPTRVVGPPPREVAVPQVNLAPLDAAVARLKVAATAYDAAYAKLNAGEVKLSAGQERQLNSLLRSLEQKLTDERGLPGREWFKHFVYAPGLLTGYGVKTLPAVREAIEAGRWAEADEYSAFTAKVLEGYCDALNQATALLRGS